jgi:tetratricopeptide (TPR) repeat protein
MSFPTDWLSASAMLLCGVIIGVMVIWSIIRSPRAATSAAEAERNQLRLADLEARRDSLVQQLRELDDLAGDKTTDQLLAERDAIEREAAGILRQLDQARGATVASAAAASPGSPRKARGGERQEANLPSAPRQAEVAPGRPALRGFLYGAGSVGAVALLAWLVTRSATPRDAAQPVSGGAMSTPAAGVTPQKDAQLSELEASVERNPSDPETHLALARGYFERADLMNVYKQAQIVLDRTPDNAQALAYQGLVRLAMGQAEPAVVTLKKAVEKDPKLIDGWVGLIYAYTRLGKTSEADAAFQEASRRRPDQAARLKQLMEQMRTAVKGTPGAQQSAEMQSGTDSPAQPGFAAAATAAAVPASGPTVNLVLDLDAAARSRIVPTSVLFVYARPAGVSSGPPVAVKRLPPGPFPMTVQISASDSMMGQALPDPMRIEARLDSDGNAMTHDASDPKASIDGVSAGPKVVNLVLR